MRNKCLTMYVLIFDVLLKFENNFTFTFSFYTLLFVFLSVKNIFIISHFQSTIDLISSFI